MNNDCDPDIVAEELTEEDAFPVMAKAAGVEVKPEPVIPEVLPPEVPASSVELTPYSTARKQQAYELFLNGGLLVKEIALQLSVTTDVIKKWAAEGHWLEKRKEIEDDLFAVSDHRYFEIVAKAKPEVVERHLAVTKKVKKRLLKRLSEDHDLPLPDLMRAAKAMKDSADVSARAAGITETPRPEAQKAAPAGPRAQILIGIKAINSSVTVEEPPKDVLNGGEKKPT